MFMHAFDILWFVLLSVEEKEQALGTTSADPAMFESRYEVAHRGDLCCDLRAGRLRGDLGRVRDGELYRMEE